ncbi:nitronate monooxygenase family protein [Mycolicibacterium sp. CBMA 226]|uniref:NAD(P)H-dependent flavin oxidoreductase n=1 Tax=Mycolicibacterium sp. CBMA 226 TaxID=2606611 RepID=UPI0012DD3164|nr:nitronate monooxygenase [Mycolicibacterium sp. CBMA 226]MUL78048.1 nitronate monooxygenase [Mycolicibacterium sp. CBMA 226]
MITTRLTDRLGIEHPIVSAPMALAAGGALAAEVSRAGGLGLIGGGYGDSDWIRAQFAAAGDERVGIGFITWSAQRSPDVVTEALEFRPAAVMLSFGDPAVFAEQVKDVGAVFICQCQNLDHVEQAISAGADIIVAQGSEAGGHGSSRGTLSLVPEVADLLSERSPDTLLLAAGGIADGRALAASLMLGADGVLLGTRLWASEEALVHPRHHHAIVESNGDSTIRSTTGDVVRGLDWPAGFTMRMRRNAFTDRWHGNEKALAANADIEGPRYRAAFADGDPDNAGVVFGEAAGLIHSIEPAATIIERMVDEASQLLQSGSGYTAKRNAIASPHGQTSRQPGL